MNYAEIKYCDIANGEGVRTTLFVSGCTHHCKNCFQPETWSFSYGEEFTDAVAQKIIASLSGVFVDGITLLGGEPMEPENQAGLLPFLTEQKKRFPKKTIWCFSGYDFEKDILGRMMQESEVTRELVPLFDVLVDGKFVEDLKNLSLKFRGSENQRILDVPRSLAAGKAVWMEQYR